MADDERLAKIAELMPESHRVLVATDCLSEAALQTLTNLCLTLGQQTPTSPACTIDGSGMLSGRG
jgi:hypothetical protein